MKKLTVVLTVTLLSAVLVYGGDTMLVKGAEAPAFELKTAEGTVFRLKDFREKNNVVLVFYPGDETPVCTKQLCEIRDDYSSFEKRGAVVFGVNPADAASHRKFSGKHEFQFPLLIDENKAVAAAYGAKGALMNKRTVYVIDRSGKIIYAQRGKPPVAEILAAIPADPKQDGTTPPAEIKLEMKQ